MLSGKIVLVKNFCVFAMDIKNTLIVGTQNILERFISGQYGAAFKAH
jgi:hypothetical protein